MLLRNYLSKTFLKYSYIWVRNKAFNNIFVYTIAMFYLYTLCLREYDLLFAYDK